MKSRDEKPRAWNSTLPAPSKPIGRGKPMERSGRIKPKRRSRDEFERVYGGAEHVEWVQRQPCFVVALELRVPRPCYGATQVCHTVTGGMGRKANSNTTVPGCASHHADYDQHRAPFDDPDIRARVQSHAATIEAAWQARSIPTPAPQGV